jgi:RNA polymerase sigma-70 factor (ECF subfamily)
VAHQAINFLREHERLQLTDLTTEIVEEEEPDIGRISAEELTRLIGLLPAGYRMVLNLYVFEQLSHKEIGHLLGIKPESSASQYSRAKQMLAREIMNYLKNDK